MYGILLVSSDDVFRSMASKFMPRIDPHMDVHLVNGPDAAILAMGEFDVTDVIVFDHRTSGDIQAFMELLDRSRIDAPLIVVSGTPESDLLGTLVNGHVWGFVARSGREPTEFFTELCERCGMAADKERNRLDHRNNERRLQVMVDMSRMDSSDFLAVVDYALESAISLTGSDMGYVATFDQTSGDMQILEWSRSAMRMCQTRYDTMKTNIKVAGIWAEPIRLGETVVVNDYQNDSRISKKGVPLGHVRMRRLLMVPIFADGKIVGTAGVGNKTAEYTRADEKQLRIVMDHLFDIRAQREREIDSVSDLNMVDRFLMGSPIGVIITDPELRVVRMNPVARSLIGASDMPDVFALDRIKTSQVARIISLAEESRITGSPQFSRMRFTDDLTDRTYDVYVQMPRDEGASSGFLIMFVDVTDLVLSIRNNRMAEDHIAVLEGPVLNAVRKTCADIAPSLANSGGFHRLMDVVTFMDDYRLAGKSEPVWLRLDDVIEKAARSCSLGETELSVKAQGIEVLADPCLHLVFKYLMLNSLEHGHGVSRMEIRCRITRGSLKIVYSDDGTGITDDVRMRMSELAESGMFGLYLVNIVSEASGFSISYPPSEDGTVVEMEVPPESYMLI